MTSKDSKAEQKRLKDDYLRTQHAASAARMPLDPEQLAAMLEHVNQAVRADGCDHTLAATEAWASRHRVDPALLRDGLEAYGGFCDCEVLMNVDVGEVFTSPRGGPRPGER